MLNLFSLEWYLEHCTMFPVVCPDIQKVLNERQSYRCGSWLDQFLNCCYASDSCLLCLQIWWHITSCVSLQIVTTETALYDQAFLRDAGILSVPAAHDLDGYFKTIAIPQHDAKWKTEIVSFEKIGFLSKRDVTSFPLLGEWETA